MKTFLTFLFILFSLPAMAQESFVLFSRGHWVVSYQVTTEGVPVCVAEVSGDGVYFSIDVRTDDLNAYYINEDNWFGPDAIDGSIFLQIDAHTPWRTPSRGVNEVILMYNLHKDFLNQIAGGSKLYIDQDGDNRFDAWFSLQGSNAALAALLDCSQKL